MSNLKNITLSIIIPVYNEAETLPECYNRLVKVAGKLSDNYELIFVNDGSIDNSLEIIKAFATGNDKVKYIDLSRNFGQQVALSAGLEFTHGERVAFIDSDLQDPPELLEDMFLKMNEGYEVVYGKRKSRKEK